MVEEAPNGARADQCSRSRKEAETFEGSKNHHLEKFDQKCPIDPQIGHQIDPKRSQSLSQDSPQAHASIFEGFAFQTPAPALIDRSPEGQLGKVLWERKSWGIDEWRKVLFSDESPFELFHLPNCQNDQIWARDKEEVPPTFTVKHPLKIQVCSLMSFRALSELHVLPEKQMVTGAYYVDEILEKSLLPTLKRTQEMGSTLQCKLLPDMSTAIFQQDGAPAHTSKVAIKWLENHLNSFWGKGVWPGNSPDLSPIENLSAIVQGELKKLPDVTNRETLIKIVGKRLGPTSLPIFLTT